MDMMTKRLKSPQEQTLIDFMKQTVTEWTHAELSVAFVSVTVREVSLESSHTDVYKLPRDK